LAAGKLAQQHGIVLMDSVASAPAISNIGDFVFKYINDNYAGKTLSKYASKTLKSIVLVYDDTDYGVALANVIRKNYQ
jgi:ABC-type branched-subunit amino acid transport system substrate-binding protein